MIVAKKFVLTKVIVGEPKLSDFTIVEEPLKPLKWDEILIEAEYISVDPYLRPFSVHLAVGVTMVGLQIGRIVESNKPRWPVGKRVVAFVGWRTHTAFNPDQTLGYSMIKHKTYMLPDFGDLPPSLGLGMLGLPGNAAYFGFLEICKPKEGETLVVSSAAGAIGSHVGQIAKIYGLIVVGIVDSDIKCKWLTNELGFDCAINFMAENLSAALKWAAPDGVDCYFDNVGGEISSTVIHQMNDNGRISVCGSVSCYNYGDIWKYEVLPKCTAVQPAFPLHGLKMEGFFVSRWLDRWYEGIGKNLGWLKEGKLRYKETVTEGFENTVKAFIDTLNGENLGKAIVKV